MYAPKKKIDFYAWHTLRERNTTIAQVCHFTTQLRLTLTKQNDNDKSSYYKINNNDKNQCLYNTYPNRFYVALRPVE